MTLETRLITYDWEKHFGSFQEATRRGSFKPLCWAKKPVLLPVGIDGVDRRVGVRFPATPPQLACRVPSVRPQPAHTHAARPARCPRAARTRVSRDAPRFPISLSYKLAGSIVGGQTRPRGVGVKTDVDSNESCCTLVHRTHGLRCLRTPSPPWPAPTKTAAALGLARRQRRGAPNNNLLNESGRTWKC